MGWEWRGFYVCFWKGWLGSGVGRLLDRVDQGDKREEQYAPGFSGRGSGNGNRMAGMLDRMDAREEERLGFLDFGSGFGGLRESRFWAKGCMLAGYGQSSTTPRKKERN